MRKQVIAIGAAIVALIIALIVLLYNFQSPEEVLMPPRRTGEDALIEAAFRSAIGTEDYSLQYPMAGQERNAFVKYDLDRDGSGEALVFYTRKEDPGTVRIHILDSQDEEWFSVGDEAGYGAQIESIELGHMSKDGPPAVILSWTLTDSDASRVLTIHTLQQKSDGLTLKTLADEPYSYMKPVDLTGDGVEEILMVAPETVDKTTRQTASLLKMNSAGSVKVYGEKAILDSNVSGYDELQLEQTENGPIAYLDAYKGSGSMITEILYWNADKQALIAPFTEVDTLTNPYTLRPVRLRCKDVDGDGKPEIPVGMDVAAPTSSSASSGAAAPAAPAASSADESSEVRLPLIGWSDLVFEGGKGFLIPRTFGFANASENYEVRVNSGVRDALTAYREPSTGVVTVYSSADGTVKNEPLFSLVTKLQTELDKDDTFTFSRQNGDIIVFGSITSAGKALKYTDDMVAKNIVFY